ncbi:MAG: hypothetical protein D6704_00965 [Nitrospirae bacterium]|nr:MAG: hypothetical protein D6704_00965 [Nitrospirota bacterium]
MRGFAKLLIGASRLRHLAWHPLCFAFFPVLFLATYNAAHISFTQVMGPLVVVWILLAGVWLILQRWYRDPHQSGLAVSWFFLLFFLYGHAVDAFSVEFLRPHRHTYALAAWILLFLAGLWGIRRLSSMKLPLTQGLNGAGALLLFFTLTHGMFLSVTTASEDSSPITIGPSLANEALLHPQSLPDMYYIVLDAYGRADSLHAIFGYDNTEFLNFLESKGFVVARTSRANYNQTWLALASALNMAYLNHLVGKHGLVGDNRKPLKRLIHRNRVVTFLKQLGYTVVSFESGQSFTDLPTADRRMPPRPPADEFHLAFWEMTPIPGVLSGVGRLVGTPYSAYQMHRDRINYAFDHLADWAGVETPIFVFAHILAPHPPFVFGPRGEPIDPPRQYWLGDGSAFMEKGGTREEYRKRYAGEIEYINARLKTVIERILARSPTPPVIILQSDHGSRLELDWEHLERTNVQETFSIFTAIHFPGGRPTGFYHELSPVNTFRLVFNTVFGTTFNLLEDRSFYSMWTAPYQFQDVTDRLW